MRDDEFDLELEPLDTEKTRPEVRRETPLFDWEKADPEDFGADDADSRETVREKTEKKPQGGFAFDIPLEEAPKREETQPEPAPVPQPSPVPAARPAPHSGAEARPAPQPDTAPGRTREGHGRAVLISGGDRGIGAETARLFWKRGYRVAILYHTAEASARALVNELGCDCMAVRCDVADYAACEAALRIVVRTFGDVEILISNAGIAQQKLFTDITPEEWKRMLDVNLTGAYNLCRLVLPAMVRAKWGRIVTVSSMWGQTGGSCEVHYSAAKAGLIGLTRALAKEEGPSGVTVNCVAPGVVDTDMMASFSAADRHALAEETPVGRLGTPQDVAQTIGFLASDTSGFITGQVFGVNGGLVI